MPEKNLLRKYPQSKRNWDARDAVKVRERDVAMKFGKEYFDGDRTQGYGGYRYDGRWVPVAKDIIDIWNLKPGDKVLDVGCAKGFLVKDLMEACPGLEVQGVDISAYAIENSPPEVRPHLQVADAKDLPFADNTFDAVLSINCIHNLGTEDCKKAIQELERVSRGKVYIQVDSYRSDEEREQFEKWQLTCKTHFDIPGWKTFFDEVGYTGDYYWTFVV